MSRTWVTVLMLAPLLALLPSEHVTMPEDAYHAAGPPEALGEAETRVLEIVDDGFALRGLTAPRRTDNLMRAARCAADVLVTDPVGAPVGEVVRACLEHSGVTDVTTWPFTLRCGPEGPALRDLRHLVRNHVVGRSVSHVGVGSSEEVDDGGQRLVVLVFVQRRVALDPFPRAARWGQSLALSGHLPPDSGFPRVLVASPSGRVHDADVYVGDGTQFWTPLEFAQGPGRYVVEVLSGDRYGPQVANLFPVHVGVPAPAVPEIRLLRRDPPRAQAAELEERLATLLNRDRARLGLAPLRYHRGLYRAARAHSADMARRDYFGHRSPEGDAGPQRLQQQGLTPPLSAEVICIAASASKGHADLMRSPSHRRAMLDGRMTHVGIGVVPVGEGSSRRLVITEEFARIP